MRCVRKRVLLLASAAALAALTGSLVAREPDRPTEASFPPGGIAALPSALPATVPLAGFSPGTEQILPAVAPASGPGSFAIVDAFCEGASCPRDQTGHVAPIEFTMSKVFPPGGSVAATFTASGEQKLLCTDDAACDLSHRLTEGSLKRVQHVAVGLTGGGENEVIAVTACDITGDCRSVQVIFVETLLVVPPLVDASGGMPALVSYRCDDVGRYTGEAVAGIVPGRAWSAEVTWEEIFDWFFYGIVQSGHLRSPGSIPSLDDIPFYSCGGDTASPVDDRVTFETDYGIFSLESPGEGGQLSVSLPGGQPLARPFGSITPLCDAGDSVDVRDHPGPVAETRFGVGFPRALADIPADWCDLDFAPNGVVTYMVWGTGESGTATVAAQQSGGGVLRSSNLTFTGVVAASLFMEAPEMVAVEGGEFSVAVVDASLRPLGGQTVSCSAEPKEAVLKIVPQTGTTAGIFDPDPGQVRFTLYPTRKAIVEGTEVSVTCHADANPDAQATATVRVGAPEEGVALLSGCNFVSWTGGETAPAGLAGRVAPAEGLTGLWAQQPSPEWKGFASEFPEVSDMGPVNHLDVVAVCMTEMGTLSRPAL
jgi:hypothetical protein